MNSAKQKEYPAIRLTPKEIENIKTSVLSIDPLAKVYLFGSRTDRTKRGGDIDILIISHKITRKNLSKIRWHFFGQFGEQRMDIVVDNGRLNTPFVRMIMKDAVEL
jgi:predicted nucleotidyltransferase